MALQKIRNTGKKYRKTKVKVLYSHINILLVSLPGLILRLGQLGIT